jgi:hypothetical protein
MTEMYWGGRLSLEGSLQALEEARDAHKRRADLAEKRLRYIRRVCENRTTIPETYSPCCGPNEQVIPVWRILEILDGAADAEE